MFATGDCQWQHSIITDLCSQPVFTSSLDILQPPPNSDQNPFLTPPFSALASQSKESSTFPIKDIQPRVFHIDGVSGQQQNCHGYSLIHGLRENSMSHGPKLNSSHVHQRDTTGDESASERKEITYPNKQNAKRDRQKTQHGSRALRKVSTITCNKRLREIPNHHHSSQAAGIQCTSSWRAKTDYSLRNANSLKQFSLLLILFQPEVVRL